MSEKLGNEPACAYYSRDTEKDVPGMTIRQKFVMAAMQGILNPNIIYVENGKPTGNLKPTVEEIIIVADACLKREAETRGE